MMIKLDRTDATWPVSSSPPKPFTLYHDPSYGFTRRSETDTEGETQSITKKQTTIMEQWTLHILRGNYKLSYMPRLDHS